MINERKGIVLINIESGERKDFQSINAAARFIGVTFGNLQRAGIYNGVCKGWKVYESADTIRQHIKDLEEQLKIVEG